MCRGAARTLHVQRVWLYSTVSATRRRLGFPRLRMDSALSHTRGTQWRVFDYASGFCLYTGFMFTGSMITRCWCSYDRAFLTIQRVSEHPRGVCCLFCDVIVVSPLYSARGILWLENKRLFFFFFFSNKVLKSSLDILLIVYVNTPRVLFSSVYLSVRKEPTSERYGVEGGGGGGGGTCTLHASSQASPGVRSISFLVE